NWKTAHAELGAAARFDPSVALEYRALLAASPFLSLPREDLKSIRDEVYRWGPPPSSAKEVPEDWFSPHDRIHVQLRSYLLRTLTIRLGERESALQSATELGRLVGSPTIAAVARALAGSLRAQVAQFDGKAAEALAILEGTSLEVAWEAPFRSAFFS